MTVSGLGQAKQEMPATISQEEPVREAEGRLTQKQLMTEAKDTAAQREPELVGAPWLRILPKVEEPESKKNVVTPVLMPRASKRAPQPVYANEQPKNSRNWSGSCDELQTKRMKNRESTHSPHGEDGVLTASPPGASGLTGSNRMRPWLNEGDADTGHARAVTSWSSRWNAWLVDLTADDESDCGSPRLTMNSSGMTDVCVRNSGQQTTTGEADKQPEEMIKQQEKTEPEQRSRVNAPPPEAGTLP